MHVGVVLADRLEVFPFIKIKSPLYYYIGLSGAHLDIPIFYHHIQCLWIKVKFACGSGDIRNEKVFPFLFPLPPLYDYLGLCGIHLYIPIVFTTTANVWEQKWNLHVGVVLAEKLQVFPFLKIKPPLWLNRVKWSPFIHSHWRWGLSSSLIDLHF